MHTEEIHRPSSERWNNDHQLQSAARLSQPQRPDKNKANIRAKGLTVKILPFQRSLALIIANIKESRYCNCNKRHSSKEQENNCSVILIHSFSFLEIINSHLSPSCDKSNQVIEHKDPSSRAQSGKASNHKSMRVC